MSFISLPKEPGLPDEPFYPIDRLYRFDRHNRLTWERTFGEQAQLWDKERRIKRWADTSVLEGVEDPTTQIVEYDYFDLASRKFKNFTISALEAALPNLPGSYVYPKYIVEETPATVVHEDSGDAQPLNPHTMCHKQEAESIVAELDWARSLNHGPSHQARFASNGTARYGDDG